MCGADWSEIRPLVSEAGSPPRVRSRPGQPLARDFPLGITSACAEQTKATMVELGDA